MSSRSPAAAREHPAVLFVGLVLSVTFMGVAASFVARLIHRFPVLAWAGLLMILYVALKMIWEGWHDVVPLISPRMPAHDCARHDLRIVERPPARGDRRDPDQRPEAHSAARAHWQGLCPSRRMAAVRRAAAPGIGRAARRGAGASLRCARRARPAKTWSNFNAMAAARSSMRCWLRWRDVDGLRQARAGRIHPPRV